MRNYVLLWFLISSLFVSDIQNAKILSIYPFPLLSHFVTFRRLFEELALKGHEVDVYTPIPAGKIIPGLNFIPIEKANIYEKSVSLESLQSFSVQGLLHFILHGPDDTKPNLCHRLFNLQGMKDLKVLKKKYDILILELFATDCVFGFAHLYKIPVVAVTTSVNLPWGANRLGNPDNPSYIPNYLTSYMPDMTLYERIVNTITLIQVKITHKIYQKVQEKEAKLYFGEDLPPLDDLISNSSIILVNSHLSFNQARPKVPNFIEIGGLHVGVPKPLDKSLSNFIGNSKFIYFSLGTVFGSDNMPVHILQSLCDNFKELGHKVIWKVDRDKLPKELNIPPNVRTEKWLPQLDVLCHPNILFFITHNGLMGTQEAISCGVPMMSTPIFADQYMNSRLVVSRNAGVRVNLQKNTKAELYSTMKELIENPKYKQNAKKISEQFRDRPRTPVEEAIFWIEYVLRHDGAPQLRSKAVELAWYQYYLVDVVAVCLSALVMALAVIYMLIKKILGILCGKSNSTKEKSS